MKKIIFIICLIMLAVLSFSACSSAVDSKSDSNSNIGLSLSNNSQYSPHGLLLSNKTDNFMFAKLPSSGVYPGTDVRVDIKIGNYIFNSELFAKCYYKITSSSLESTSYLIFYIFNMTGYEITDFSSAGRFTRYYIDSNNLYKEIYIPNLANHIQVANKSLVMAYKYHTEYLSTSPLVISDRLTLTLKNSVDVYFNHLDSSGNFERTTKKFEFGSPILADFELPKLEHATFVDWYRPLGFASCTTTFSANYNFKKFNIVFYDYSNKELTRSQCNAYSRLSVVPAPPDVLGLTFLGWSTEYFNKDKIINNVVDYKAVSDMSLYATYSGGSVMPGPGQNNPLHKECEWWDVGQHLINFVGWLLFDMPIIKDVVALIYSLIIFLTSMFGFLGVFAPMGFVGTLLIGIFGLFFLFKAIF